MLDYTQIQELIKLVSETSMQEVKIEVPDFKINIKGENFGKVVNAPPPTIVHAASPVQNIVPAVQPQATAPIVATPVADSGKTTEPAPAAEAPQADNLITIKSPMIGTFYRSSSPDKPPFIKVGDSIEVGNVICIVEAMKLFNEIESEVSGKIVKVFAENATPVEYDTPLFLVEPA